MQNQQFKYSNISLSEILHAGMRFEASVFNLEAKQARELIKNCGFPVVSLLDKSLVESASYPNRFKRNYVKKDVGLPFILPSQISEIDPKPSKWIYGLKSDDLDKLCARQWDLLLTRSGTIGQCSLANKSLDGKVMSDDLIRIVTQDKYRGYLYIFIKSKVGQLLLQTSNYGAVIQHIEPTHLAEIEVPVPTDDIVEKINTLVSAEFTLIDQSNDLIHRAQELLISTLNLLPIDQINPDNFNNKNDVVNFSKKITDENFRLDASFHKPLASKIEETIISNGFKLKNLGDEELTTRIILPGRFKRIYVDEFYGVPFLGGKEILDLDPRTEKNLSLEGHGPRIKDQLTIKRNQVMVTCSGTIGKVNIAPKHWEGWTSSQHVIRIESTSDWMAGYLFAWLSTDYGVELIKRFTYGAVVDEIEDHHLGLVSVPLINEDTMRIIGRLVLRANEKRSWAFRLQNKAKRILNDEVLVLN
jgi:type I restriction enzyme, S subunit